MEKFSTLGVATSRLLVGAAVLAILIAAGFLLNRDRSTPPPAPTPLPPAEVVRSELTLLDDQLVRRGETNPFTGFVTEYYAGDLLKSRSAVSNGLLEGLSEGFYTNGQRQVEEPFRAGVSHGLRRKWYENGERLSEAMIVDGELHGTFRRWHTNGVLAEEVEMRNGKPEGLSLAFFPSGYLKARVRLRGGEVVEQTFWKEEDREPAPAVTDGGAPTNSP